MSIPAKVLFAGAAALTAIAVLSFAPTWEVAAQGKMLSTAQVERPALRNIAPNRGRLVLPNMQFKAKGAGGTGVVCCTHWNTQTGGTGCATYPDSCPSNTFTVECGKDGCW